MAQLTDEEKRRILRYLDQADADESRSNVSSRRSFFRWLGDLGLGAIVTKIVSWAWGAIRTFFGF